MGSKKSYQKKTSNHVIDHIYKIAINNGAYGGKLLGAGGGGFMLIFADPSTHSTIRKKLHPLVSLNCHIDFDGTKIVYKD